MAEAWNHKIMYSYSYSICTRTSGMSRQCWSLLMPWQCRKIPQQEKSHFFNRSWALFPFYPVNQTFNVHTDILYSSCRNQNATLFLKIHQLPLLVDISKVVNTKLRLFLWLYSVKGNRWMDHGCSLVFVGLKNYRSISANTSVSGLHFPLLPYQWKAVRKPNRRCQTRINTLVHTSLKFISYNEIRNCYPSDIIMHIYWDSSMRSLWEGFFCLSDTNMWKSQGSQTSVGSSLQPTGWP